MKKLFCLTLSVILSICLIGCSDINGSTPKETDEAQPSYIFESGIDGNKPWEKQRDPDDPRTDILTNAIPDAETAAAVANAIFKKVQAMGCFPSHALSHVFFDEEDKIWVAYFNYTEPGAFGTNYCVALRQQNGEVVRMWSEP